MCMTWLKLIARVVLALNVLGAGVSALVAQGGKVDKPLAQGKPAPRLDPEAGVEAALSAGRDWLIQHQGPDGNWSMSEFQVHGKCNCGDQGRDQPIAGTAFGLLPLLGAPTDPKTGKLPARYVETVERGVKFLLLKQARDGDFGGGMYNHALATMAVCRAYLVSADPKLKQPAQRGVDFIVGAQNALGGWDYTARGATADTSIGGWQIQALKLGQQAGLQVPRQSWDGANRWLDARAGDPEGAIYGYRSPGGTPSTSAIGLYCRQQLGWAPTQRGLTRGIENLKQRPPNANVRSMYYYHYATRVMYQRGGDAWRFWKPRLRDLLLDEQDQGKNARFAHQKGSWSARTWDVASYGGGRIMMTSLALLSLELKQPSLSMANVPPRLLDPAEVEGLWRELAGEEFPNAYQALGTLAADPKRTVSFLKEHLKPVTPADARQVERLIADLDSDQFAVRQRASQELDQLGDLAESYLRKALEGKPTLEVRRRADDLLRKIEEQPPSGEVARVLRALSLLEHFGTSEAREVLRMMTKGTPGVRVTREAAAALDRLAERNGN